MARQELVRDNFTRRKNRRRVTSFFSAGILESDFVELLRSESRSVVAEADLRAAASTDQPRQLENETGRPG